MSTDAKTGLPIRLYDEDLVAYSENNPLPVSLEESEGDEINDFLQDDDVLKNGGSANHDYTVSAGKTLQVEQVIFGGSGRAKFELQVEDGVGAGTFTTLAVGFISTSKLSDSIEFKRAQKVAAGVKVRVVKTNLDNQDANLYSTIVGLEK